VVKAQTRSTGLNRRHRHGPVLEELGFASRFVSGRIQAQAAIPTVPPRPFGELGRASTGDVADLAGSAWRETDRPATARRTSARAALEYLAGFPGATWQERWDASPLGQGVLPASSVMSVFEPSQTIGAGVRSLFCLRVVQPSVIAMRRNKFRDYPLQFVPVQSDPLLDKFIELSDAYEGRWEQRQRAQFDLCCLLTTHGVGLADVTPASLLHYTHETRAARVVLRDGKKDANQLAGTGTWNVLQAMGHFAPGTPQTMRAALLRGQQTIEEVMDRWPIRNQEVRQLLIDYGRRRSVDADYSTVTGLLLLLAHHFWEKIERLNPDQADLRIDPEIYEHWREQINTRDDGRARVQVDDILIAVRSFYLDLHTWAAEEPERWAAWVAPCPIPPSGLRGVGDRRRRINERTADRTRVRQPLLPVLVAHVEARHDHARRLLEHAAATPDGVTFTLDGRTYRRWLSPNDLKRAKYDEPPVRVIDEAAGETIHVSTREEATFWEWAAVETLRHSGVRIEELTELTHLSVRQFQRANGEVVALLVIAPSKTDRERVIPMSAELFHVIAQIIRRHTRAGKPIPQLCRFDPHDKVWSSPLPFLFQRFRGTTHRVINTGTILRMLQRRCEAIAQHNPAFRGLSFTPHDFRRIFATELVNSGLPIHIGAALLGHLNIQTTRGYVAVFDEDVVRHYQEYLHHRRTHRPEDEYRSATAEEWTEFEEHFDKRRVELGSCARPYGTPCQHEHACIRCPMLHVNPKMIGRLDELEHDLIARRQRAENENWRGEIEGLDLTLTFLRTKREEAQRLARRPLVQLGIPQPRGDSA
jgi:site-specific recombinase XerC